VLKFHYIRNIFLRIENLQKDAAADLPVVVCLKEMKISDII